MESVALELRARLAAHPAAVHLMIGGPTDGPHALALNEWLLDPLDDAGLNPTDAARASYLLIVYVFGLIALEVADLHQPGALQPKSERITARRLACLTTPADHYPRTRRGRSAKASYISTEQYIRRLHRVLDGITSMAASPEARAPTDIWPAPWLGGLSRARRGFPAGEGKGRHAAGWLRLRCTSATRRSASEILLEAVHIADARGRAAVDVGDPDAAELQEESAALARTAVDRFGASYDARVSKEQVEALAAAVRAGMDAAGLPETHRKSFLALCSFIFGRSSPQRRAHGAFRLGTVHASGHPCMPWLADDERTAALGVVHRRCSRSRGCAGRCPGRRCRCRRGVGRGRCGRGARDPPRAAPDARAAPTGRPGPSDSARLPGRPRRNRRLGRSLGVTIELRTAGRPVPLRRTVELAAYRIVQEALTNVVAHAGPCRVEVVLDYRPDALDIEIVDNGSLIGTIVRADFGRGRHTHMPRSMGVTAR